MFSWSFTEEDAKRTEQLYDPYTAYQSIPLAYKDSNESGKTLKEKSNASTKADNVQDPTSQQFVMYCQYYGYNPNDPAVQAYWQGKVVS